jgi:hypothetical protein
MAGRAVEIDDTHCGDDDDGGSGDGSGGRAR